jgi:hypothetical protein
LKTREGSLGEKKKKKKKKNRKADEDKSKKGDLSKTEFKEDMELPIN